MSLIYAHRGASAYAPENTLEAFRLAMEMGADGIELDVHLTKDGELAVIHDEALDRTTNGTGQVKDFTMAQLKELDASNGKAAYPGAKIPTLGEVYDLVRDSGMTVNVELKTDANFYPGIEAACLKLEREKGMTGRVIYSSFNHYTIANLRALDKDARLGLLYMSGLYEPWNYAKQVTAQYIHPFYASMLLPGLAEGCLENGIGINAWTIDDPGMMELCLEKGANIITNVPDTAISLRQSYGAEKE